MAIGGDPAGDAHSGATLRGVIVIVAAGLALGGIHNAIGLASRPPRGLPWVKPIDTAATLETLQRDSLTTVPATGVMSADATAPAAPRADKPAAIAATPLRTAPPASSPGAPPPTAPAPPPASALPVIPDLDRPVRLELPSLKKLYDAGAVLVVDARDAAEYAEGHVAGATSLPYNDALAEPARIERLGEAGRPIAVYCSGGACELSMDLAKLMLEHGRRKVLVYEGGYPEWQAAGYPVARGMEPGGPR